MLTVPRPPKPETTKAPALKNSLFRTYLPAGEAVLTYAKSRGLTQETLDRFCVGQHQTPSAMWMTMPTIHGERLMGVKMRNLNATDKRRRFAQIPGVLETPNPDRYGELLLRLRALTDRGELP